MLKSGKIDDFSFSLHFHATFPLPSLIQKLKFKENEYFITKIEITKNTGNVEKEKKKYESEKKLSPKF